MKKGSHHSKASKYLMSLAILHNPKERKRRSKRCIARSKSNNYFKDFLNDMSDNERAIFLKGNGIKVSLSFTPQRIERARELGRERCLGNSYLKNFFERLSIRERKVWLKRKNTNTSLGMIEYYKANPERIETIRIFMREKMLGNTIRKNYLIKNPVYTPPNWNDHTPYESVPEFVPIPTIKLSVEQQTDYFCLGRISPGILEFTH